MRVEMMLRRGWPADLMRQTAKAVMSRKNGGPPSSIRYFEPAFARAYAQQSTPALLTTAKASKKDTRHAEKIATRSDWQRSRDEWREAQRELGRAVDEWQ